jgi:hypothetical protein
METKDIQEISAQDLQPLDELEIVNVSDEECATPHLIILGKNRTDIQDAEKVYAVLKSMRIDGFCSFRIVHFPIDTIIKVNWNLVLYYPFMGMTNTVALRVTSIKLIRRS